MKITKGKIITSIILLSGACGTLRAQEIRGVVLGSDNQPLLGASVFWEGTTVGTGTNVSGEFSLHRVKGYDRLIASYLGFVNDTLRVEPGAERINFVLRPDGM